MSITSTWGGARPAKPDRSTCAARLVGETSLERGNEFLVAKKPSLIGRHEQADVRLSHVSVSRRHALIQWVDGAFRIMDLSSRYGTFVNGERINEQSLHDGDRLRIGLFTHLRFWLHVS